MKQCVKFPEDKFLAVRRCLVAICMGNRPAANLLSILLFRYNLRMENKDDAENQNAVKTAKGESPDQDTSVRIYRTQAQLVEDMCGEMTEKTLHDTAVPMLQLLGFLDLEEHMIANCYILHIDLVQQALNLYLPGKKEQPQLEIFLIEHMQLEKFLITSDELEKFLINKKNFQLGLEKVLIGNRNISNQQRGRKLRADVPLRGKKRLPKNIEEDSKKDIEEERARAFSENENQYQHDHSRVEDAWACNNWRGAHKGKTCVDYQAYIDSGEREETPTEPRTPIVTIGATDGNTTGTDIRSHRTTSHTLGSDSDDALQDTRASAEHQPQPGDVGHFQRTSGDERDAARHQIQPHLAIGAPDGHPTPDHPTADHRATDSVRADGPGEPETSVEQTIPARSAPPSERNDGAATVRESSGPRASDETLPDVIDVLLHPEKLHASQKPLSLKEDEPTVRPETPAQRKRRIEAREKEIWALVEEKLGTKFTRTQRQSAANTAGMENLIEDETDDETIKTALERLTDFWRAQFNLKQFHALIPGLLAAKAPTPTTNGKPANSDAPVKRWSMAEHKRMLKELEASQHNLQA